MKKTLLSFAALASLSMVGMLFFNQGNLYSNANGAPGPTTCSAGGCHSDGGAAQESADVVLTVKDAQGNTVTGYKPGETYTITFGKQNASVKVGFALSATSGTLAKNSGDVKIQKIGTYLTHTAGGTSVPSGDAEWTATWTAPASGTPTLRLFINQTNSDANNTGDMIFTKSVQLTRVTTGLSAVSDDVKFKLFPNPVSETLFISFEVKVASPLSIQLISIDGKQTMELFNGTEAKGKMDKSFDVSQMAKGVYLLNIHTSEGNVTQKIMIN